MKNRHNRSTQAVVEATVKCLQSTIERLNIAMRTDIPAEAADAIVGAVTREAMGRLNVTRSEFVFDCIDDPNETALRIALKRIRDARDFKAEEGRYPTGTVGPDQEFDDWAADVASEALSKSATEAMV